MWCSKCKEYERGTFVFGVVQVLWQSWYLNPIIMETSSKLLQNSNDDWIRLVPNCKTIVTVVMQKQDHQIQAVDSTFECIQVLMILSRCIIHLWSTIQWETSKGENFHGLLACAAKGCHTPNFRRENILQIATKPQNFGMFSLLKVSRSMISNPEHYKEIQTWTGLFYYPRIPPDFL